MLTRLALRRSTATTTTACVSSVSATPACATSAYVALPSAPSSSLSTVPSARLVWPTTTTAATRSGVSVGVSHTLAWSEQTRSIFIQTEDTPNPSSLKFVPSGEGVLSTLGSEVSMIDFPTADAARASPLASALFKLPAVKGVFLGSDFITVSKTDDADWLELKPEVFAIIMDFYASGQDILADEVEESPDTVIHDDDSDEVAMIKEILETRIRPAVRDDGGNIVFHGFENGIVYLKMQGSCAGCPSSAVTLKAGIETMLMHYVPEVEGVEEIKEEWEQEGINQFNSLEEQLAARRAAEEAVAADHAQLQDDDELTDAERARMEKQAKEFSQFFN